MSGEHILVIKHGALGDIIIATAGFAAIRAQHPDAHITCLTTRPYAELLAQSPYFNEIWVDSKPKLFERAAGKRLKAMLRSQPWAWIYDLQTSKRSTLYPWLLARPWPRISNASRFASHGYTDPARHTKHAFENLKIQLGITGIRDVGMPNISWLQADIGDIAAAIGSRRAIPQGEQLNPCALLVPGGAAHRPEKRWPAEQYASLAQELAGKGIRPVLIGTAAEAEALDSIATRVPAALNLGGKTSIAQLATLARAATLAVGNDTGPMHVIAATGCPATVLFSHASDPVRSAPIGAAVTILREMDLQNLSVDRVLATLTAGA
ncbi:MAG: glycosyltransferase family 9 protein [Alphaproteobacteria bacterium]|nr:glycosyltransferase family 9 protein [Alphaproteobacteria bacterium]